MNRVYMVEFCKPTLSYRTSEDEEYILGVFSTEEKAKEFINNYDLKKLDEDYTEEDRKWLSIEEYVIDSEIKQ